MCEPQMGKRGLYPSLSSKNENDFTKGYMDFLQYADGTNSLEKISSLIKLDLKSVKKIYSILIKNKLIDTKNIIIDSKSGYSGAGKKFDFNKMKSKNDFNFYNYNTNNHRHIAEIKQELNKKAQDKKKDAKSILEKIQNKSFEIKKLSTENNELYGSVKPTEISKLIHEKNKVEIKPSMIQPVEEIKSLGKFKVKISLHSEVDAEITINVSSADTIQ